MLRWGHDIIFLRVICISLIAIALIFALILTNVFVDVESFFMSKTPKKEDLEKYMSFVNEAYDDLYNMKNSKDQNTLYRYRRMSNEGTDTQGSYKSIYKDKNNKNNIMYNIGTNRGSRAKDLLQLDNMGMTIQFLHNKTDPQKHEELGDIRSPSKTLFKLRSKRQSNYADGTTDKTYSYFNNNVTMEGNRHIDIEIKTHFDSKTTDRGRKEFITHLIDKIRRALRSDTEVVSNQIENEPYFKTRAQEPIVIAKKIILDTGNIPLLNNYDRRRIDKHTVQTHIIPKFKKIKTSERGNKYLEDFKNSLETRFLKPIADNVDINKVNSDLNPDYKSLSLLFNNIGGGVSAGYDRKKNDPSIQNYSGLENFVKVYHNTIM